LPRDASIDRLSDDIRAAMSKHWQRRARSELRIGRAFAAMVPVLRAVNADDVVVDLLTRSASDEQRHAAICHALAQAYAGATLAGPDADSVALPHFGASDERLEAALLIAGTCCVNETIATAYIACCLEASTAPLARAANRWHLREEIDHARLGWAHLASSAITSDHREALGDCIVRLLDANVPLWERPDAFLPAAGVPDHGQPSQAAIDDTVTRAVWELVLPGFAHVGIDVSQAANWRTDRNTATSL
jgi:hypothetical protein